MAGLEKTKDGPHTWGDYQSWPVDERWEIIQGEPFAMTPSPTSRHQKVVLKLATSLDRFLALAGQCEVFPAPMDLKFSDADVVQPDLFVICDPKQNKGSHFEGPPRLIVEVLSASTAYHDRIRKLSLYARHGVQEVWLFTPFPSSVEVFFLSGDAYLLKFSYGKEETLESPSFPGLQIDLSTIFDFPVDPEEAVHLVKEGRPGYGQV